MLITDNITVKYPDGTVGLKNFGFTANNGESIALIGANGAGKTTFFLSAVGVLGLYEGSITVDDIELNKKNLKEIRKKIGLVFQNPDDQLFMPNIYDDIAFGPRNMGLNEEQVKELVENVLKTLNIEHLRNKSSLKLSGGEKRMAAIAGVIIMEPSVILFDEPTAFLDPKARQILINTISRLPQTKIIATHDMEFAKTVCEKTLLIKGGEVVKFGGTEEILTDKELIKSALGI